MRAVDADGAPVPPGTPGRAQVRGPSLFRGYARKGQVVPPDLTADGFLPTGDIAALQPDGTVSIRGREKDVIIRGGHRVDLRAALGAGRSDRPVHLPRRPPRAGPASTGRAT